MKTVLTYKIIQEIKEVNACTHHRRISTYVPTAKYRGRHAAVFGAFPRDIVLPCATQNELDAEAAKEIVARAAQWVCSKAQICPAPPKPLPLSRSAGLLFSPGKASNAGGVATSGLEMSQNSERLSWTFEEVDAKLKGIMESIYHRLRRGRQEVRHGG